MEEEGVKKVRINFNLGGFKVHHFNLLCTGRLVLENSEGRRTAIDDGNVLNTAIELPPLGAKELPGLVRCRDCAREEGEPHAGYCRFEGIVVAERPAKEPPPAAAAYQAKSFSLTPEQREGMQELINKFAQDPPCNMREMDAAIDAIEQVIKHD